MGNMWCLQEGCAAAATVATEVLYGASPAWRDTSCLLGPATSSNVGPGSSRGAVATASSSVAPDRGAGSLFQQPVMAPADGGNASSHSAVVATSAELSRCAELLLELLSDERLAGLPTHAEAAAAVAGQSVGPRQPGSFAGSDVALAAHWWSPQVPPCWVLKTES
jgi:hypothetical protein